MSKRKRVPVRMGDRVIFKDGIEREGIVLEVSPSGKRVKVQQVDNHYRTYWLKWTCVVELLRPLLKRRWFS